MPRKVKLENIYIYGNGAFAKKIIKQLPKNIKVSGILTSSDVTRVNNVLRLKKSLNKELPIYVCIFNHYDDPLTIKKMLQELGFATVLFPSEFIKKIRSEFNQYFLTNNLKSLPSGSKVQRVQSQLYDELSKKILAQFIAYQSGGKIENILRNGTSDEQYLGRTLPAPFHKYWISNTQKVRWVNVGAYDGDTLQNLQRIRKSKIKSDLFICIEPSEYNFRKLYNYVTENKIKAIMICNAVSDTNFLTHIEHDDISSSISKINSSRPENVFAFKLDEVLGNFNPTHINMDIEGSELQALQGAAKSIIKTRPMLVISLYHGPTDIVDIPIYLFKLLKNYNWFIRCYGSHFYDTVLYGIPIKTHIKG